MLEACVCVCVRQDCVKFKSSSKTWLQLICLYVCMWYVICLYMCNFSIILLRSCFLLLVSQESEDRGSARVPATTLNYGIRTDLGAVLFPLGFVVSVWSYISYENKSLLNQCEGLENSEQNQENIWMALMYIAYPIAKSLSVSEFSRSYKPELNSLKFTLCFNLHWLSIVYQLAKPTENRITCFCILLLSSFKSLAQDCLAL